MLFNGFVNLLLYIFEFLCLLRHRVQDVEDERQVGVVDLLLLGIAGILHDGVDRFFNLVFETMS